MRPAVSVLVVTLGLCIALLIHTPTTHSSDYWIAPSSPTSLLSSQPSFYFRTAPICNSIFSLLERSIGSEQALHAISRVPICSNGLHIDFISTTDQCGKASWLESRFPAASSITLKNSLHRLREIAKDVEIVRDKEFNVPHIYGATDELAAFGLAYAHSEDDFKTIQQVILAARGKLAAVTGDKKHAEMDYIYQLFEVEKQVDENMCTQHSAKTLSIMHYYALGLNYYAALHLDEVLTTDSSLLFPVTARDVVLSFVFKLPMFFRMDQVLKHIMEEDPYYMVSMGSDPIPLSDEMPEHNLSPLGSNAFALSRNRSATNSTLLAINSHQPWTGPVAWYEAHVVSEEGWNVYGCLFPGSPVLLMGANERFGWAHTVNQPDLVDVYLMRSISSEDGAMLYEYDGQPMEYRQALVSIEVHLFGPFSYVSLQPAYWSVYGPVLQRNHGTYSIRWAGFNRVGVVEQWYQVNKAKSFDEFRAALGLGQVPMFNTVYADKEDNIFYLYNGLLPERHMAYLWSVFLDGSTSETLWKTYFPYSSLPSVLNPPSGFVQNCNSSPYNTTMDSTENPRDEDYPFELGIEKRMTNRARRLLEIFSRKNTFTWEEFVEAKYDMEYSIRSDAAFIIATLLKNIEPLLKYSEDINGDPVIHEAVELLSSWDLRTDPENKAAALGVLTVMPYIRLHSFQEDPMEIVRKQFERVIGHFIQTARNLHEKHGRVDVPWKEVNRIVRGEIEMGMGGAPDVLHAVHSDLREDYRLIGRAGDCFIQMVRWDNEGESERVHMETIHQFGSASTREESEHYANQMEMFTERKLKKAHFYKEDVLQHGNPPYSPGNE